MDKRADKRGFNYHVKAEHNIWNYVFYLSFLLNKNKSDYLGFETYVADKLESDDISWFPLHRLFFVLLSRFNGNIMKGHLHFRRKKMKIMRKKERRKMKCKF